MAKLIPDAIIDLMLAECEGVRVHVCSAEPATAVQANTTYQLATETISGAHYTAANGDTSGRKNTLAPPSGSTIDNTGTATHVAVTSNASPDVLLLVTTCTSQALTAAGTVDIGSFDHEIGDAT